MIKADIRKLLNFYLALAVEALSVPADEEAGTPAIPFTGKQFVQPGTEVAWDQCDCDGQIWSRMVRAEPIYDTPKANGIPCVVRWDVQLAVGVLRCVAQPTQGTNGRVILPSGDQITDDGHRFADDILDLMTAIECDTSKYRVVEAVPLGPNGGCAGSEVRFIVRVTPCCD